MNVLKDKITSIALFNSCNLGYISLPFLTTAWFIKDYSGIRFQWYVKFAAGGTEEHLHSGDFAKLPQELGKCSEVTKQWRRILCGRQCQC